MLLRSVLLGLMLCTTATAAPDTVILVRHAEKADEPGGDPALSVAGQARAEALAQALAQAGVNQIVATQFRRTRDTAAPLALARGLTPQVVDAGSDLAAHVAAVAEAVRGSEGVVLVVGHSNTLPPIIAALGGPALPMLCETSFGHAFVLSPDGEAAKLQHWHYGAADPAPQADCL